MRHRRPMTATAREETETTMDTSTCWLRRLRKATAVIFLGAAFFAGMQVPCAADEVTRSADPASYAGNDRSTWLLEATRGAQEEIATAIQERGAIAAQENAAHGTQGGDFLASLIGPLGEARRWALPALFFTIVVLGFFAGRRWIRPARRVSATMPPEALRTVRDPLPPARSVAGAAAARTLRAAEVSRAASPHEPPPSNDPKTLWGKILRLAASGVPGDEIAHSLGASQDDVQLVLALERKRAELAGALAAPRGAEGHRA